MTSIQEIDVYQSDSSEVQHVETPVSALSDVHQEGLRAVSLHQVLRRCGKLAGPRLTKNDHSCSRELAMLRLEYFISHNWQVERWRKFLTLAIYFNMYKALAGCVLVGITCASLVIAGVLPCFKIEAEIGGELVTTHISIWCTIGSLLGLLLSLTLSHDLLLCLGHKGPDVFLDKVCVDQFDDEKKQQGIHALTSYLWHTDELIVVLSERYLERIWTVFELISFLLLKPDGKVDVLPVELASFVIYMAICQSFRIIGELVNSYFAPVTHAETRAVVWLVGGALFYAFCTALIVPMRQWGRVRAHLSQQMETFTFQSSSCQQESDREEILSALVTLAIDRKIVKDFETTEQVCEILEARARDIVPKSMHEATSFGGLPARSLLIVFIPLLASELDPIAAEICAGEHEMGHIMRHLLHVLLVAFSWPWFIALMGCSTCFQRQRCIVEALVLCIGGLVLAAYIFVGRVIRNLPEIYEPSAGNIALVFVLLAFEVAFFFCIFWPPSRLLKLFAAKSRGLQDAGHKYSTK